MLKMPTWKRILIMSMVALAILLGAPNAIPKDTLEKIRSVTHLSLKTVNLGLDLQGGSHILLQVDLDSVTKQRSSDILASLRPALRDKKIGYKRLNATDNGVEVTLRDPADEQAIRSALATIDNGLTIPPASNGVLSATFSDVGVKGIKDQILAQSIEIVRRRIDETGTNEPVIQRQGDDRIVVELPGLDDPQRVKDLLGKTAKLSFHLVNMDVENSNIHAGGGDLILPMADDPTKTLAVERIPAITGDMLVTAAYAQDQQGQPAVSFRFNPLGTKKFCDLSKDNVNRLFAIVLDGQVISSPVIREPICGGQGQISGSFTLKEANDLAILLRAGALPAPLNIVEERSVGPSLGADSIQAGKMAALMGLALVFVLMISHYALFGVFACIGMLINLTICFAFLSVMQATLTMPGIAGLVLTVCMSVDANVLIFERIREELREGHSPISAIDNGFRIAFGTILDSNLTALFASLILFSFGTGPIKGFAVTTAIGVIASFFTAISVVRLMVVYWLGHKRPTALPV